MINCGRRSKLLAVGVRDSKAKVLDAKLLSIVCSVCVKTSMRSGNAASKATAARAKVKGRSKQAKGSRAKAASSLAKANKVEAKARVKGRVKDNVQPTGS